MAAELRPETRPFVLFALALMLFALVAWINRPGSELQSSRAAGLPFGCVPTPNRGFAVQDFGYNLIYLHGIAERVVAHPYRQEEQEALIRHWLPTAASGMSHAYSPVALVLAQPFLWLPGEWAYLVYCLGAAAGFILLYRFCLLPRAVDRLQLGLLIACLLNLTVVTAFEVGQSAPVTTPLLGFFWWMLQRRILARTIAVDLLLGLLFWAMCLKPSFAVIPLALLLGARAWTALVCGGGLLALTWAALGPFYGGWIDGLGDYARLLENYHYDAMIPFMRDVFTRHGDTGANAYLSTFFPEHSALFFGATRLLFLGATALLAILRLSRRIAPSTQFQGMIWIFLLLCPYLLPAEDCILCLLIVEGDFFRSRGLWLDAAKMALMLAILNLRAGLNFPGQINFPLKCFLLAWIISTAIRSARSKLRST